MDTADVAATITELAGGLKFPEGPVACDDGSVLLVQLGGESVCRVRPDGTVETVAVPGGSPNGLAIGPDGAGYVANSGGWEFHHLGDDLVIPGTLQPDDYSGGRIESVDLDTGEVSVLYTECDGHALNGPNDLVFDAQGGMWFTDHGKQRKRVRDHGGVYYASPDGSSIREVLWGLDAPNGIGLSPDGSELYVAETFSGRVWGWAVSGPGALVAAEGMGALATGGRLVCGLPGQQYFDSLAVDSEGYVVVGTLVNGGLTVAAPDGSSVEHVPLPDAMVTNVCFGGPDLRTAYVTLSASGRLASLEWPRPGLRLSF